MSGITDTAATQAHDIVEQAENEEQRVQGDNAVTGERKTTTGLESSNPSGASGQHAETQSTSKLGKIKEALHLNK
ncbi:hypothetical protein VM1G_00770 [Cytospora mali]|uniref:Uncharacterized protein n=1 Tax=Cytospora mali TaxID=578113 RepID=A0A194VKX9_CYTMA|nr:hypothetical protein VM1G_00770 [Valsa mali]